VEALDGLAWVVQVSDLHLSAFNYLPDHYAHFGDKEGDLRCAPGASPRARRASRGGGGTAAGAPRARPRRSRAHAVAPGPPVAAELPTLMLSSRPTHWADRICHHCAWLGKLRCHGTHVPLAQGQGEAPPWACATRALRRGVRARAGCLRARCWRAWRPARCC